MCPGPYPRVPGPPHTPATRGFMPCATWLIILTITPANRYLKRTLCKSELLLVPSKPSLPTQVTRNPILLVALATPPGLAFLHAVHLIYHQIACEHPQNHPDSNLFSPPLWLPLLHGPPYPFIGALAVPSLWMS